MYVVDQRHDRRARAPSVAVGSWANPPSMVTVNVGLSLIHLQWLFNRLLTFTVPVEDGLT